MGYATSFYSVVDLAAVLPFYIGQLTPLAAVNTSFIRALRLLRMFKAEAYVEAFTVFDDIIYNNRDILTVTGFASAILWVFFSSVMYLLEKDNSALLSPRGDHYYASIPASMWITLLNLTGEVRNPSPPTRPDPTPGPLHPSPKPLCPVYLNQNHYDLYTSTETTMPCIPLIQMPVPMPNPKPKP